MKIGKRFTKNSVRDFSGGETRGAIIYLTCGSVLKLFVLKKIFICLGLSMKKGMG